METGKASFIRKYIFVFFLVLTFLISWIPWFTGNGGVWVFGPSIAGIITIAVSKGREGLRNLLKSLLRANTGIKWWLLALLVPGGIALMAIAVSFLLGGQPPAFTFFKEEWYFAPVFFIVTIIGGPLGEEIGWRGFALPHLQQRRSAIFASIVIGVIWGVWHLPQFFTPGTVHHTMGISYMPLFVLGEIALSVFMSWIFNNTRCSLLLGGLIFHNADNFWGVVLTTNATMTSSLKGVAASIDMRLWVISIILYALLSVLLVWRTRGKLGYSKTDSPIPPVSSEKTPL
jgi:membrane protease YdiL (CAAX protease family)